MIEDFSPGILQALELAPEQLSGQPLLKLFTPRGGLGGHARLLQELSQGESVDLEYRRPDGVDLVLRAGALPIGPPVNGYLVHMQDRTREVRAKDELFHLSRLTTVGRLFSGMVHEINNTLSGIVGYAQLLLLDQRAPEIHGDLKKILEEALRTSQLVENVLSFLRLRAMKMGEVRLPDVIERAIRLRGHSLKTEGIRVRQRAMGSLPPLVGDEILMRQVIVNVITNAEKSILSLKRGGTIKIHARQVGSQVRLVITDDGPGVPSGMEEKIFTPFFSTRPEGDGCGLGLSICRDIMELHDASIRVRPHRTGGASFVLTFNVPAARPRPTRPVVREAPAAVAPSDRRLRVVVIDDESPSREVIARTFARPGNEVIAFDDSEAALRHITSHPVDLIISDIHRPGLDGISFYKGLQLRIPSLARRVVFVTGDLVSDDVASFLRMVEPARQLRKPIQIPQLIEAARAALEVKASPEKGDDPRPKDAVVAGGPRAASRVTRQFPIES